MSANTDAVYGQLLREIEVVRHNLAILTPEQLLDAGAGLASAVRRLSDDLCSADDRLAAQAAVDIVNALWPHSAPCPDDPSWWSTPLGRMVARSGGVDGSDAVTRSVAAAMLGVHPGTVARLVDRGTLDRHPDGGITRAAVFARLARLR